MPCHTSPAWPRKHRGWQEPPAKEQQRCCSPDTRRHGCSVLRRHPPRTCAATCRSCAAGASMARLHRNQVHLSRALPRSHSCCVGPVAQELCLWLEPALLAEPRRLHRRRVCCGQGVTRNKTQARPDDEAVLSSCPPKTPHRPCCSAPAQIPGFWPHARGSAAPIAPSTHAREGARQHLPPASGGGLQVFLHGLHAPPPGQQGRRRGGRPRPLQAPLADELHGPAGQVQPLAEVHVGPLHPDGLRSPTAARLARAAAALCSRDACDAWCARCVCGRMRGRGAATLGCLRMAVAAL
jgi:hypothetical protein